MNKLLLVSFLGLALSGCGPIKHWFAPHKDRSKANGAPSNFIEASGPLSLQAFASCREADSYLQTNFRRKIRESLDQQYYHLMHFADYWGHNNERAMSETAGSASDKAAGPGPQDYTQTNTQVTGIDEPDIMKTDGQHIYTLSGTSVKIAASWPASTLRTVSSIPILGQPLGLMLSEQKNLIVVYHPQLVANDTVFNGRVPWWSSISHDSTVTRLAFYNVSAPEAPKLERELTFYGSYLSMRRQGDVVRLIQSEAFLSFPSQLKSYIEIWNPKSDKPISLLEFQQKRAELELENEQILAQLTLSSYLAELSLSKKGIKFDDPLLSEDLNCQSLLAEERMSNLGLSKITSIKLSNYELSQVALLAPANQIYASHNSLFLANSYHGWWWGWEFAQGAKTYLHKFSFDPQGSPSVSYQASGIVDGYLLNQFAMDEHKDHLRVAVTDDQFVERIDRETARPVFTSINRVYVLGVRGNKLEVVGKTPDLAPGERIYATRFVEDRAYVVTFRQVDPLFTLDLSEASAPKVLGELKIPGFSNYLHPIDAKYLLGVGQDADPNSGRVRGLKISLFDVSDAKNPKEAHSHLVTSSNWSWSEAQYDHKAFTYFASRGLLGLPVGGYRRSLSSNSWWDQYFSELMVFHIDVNTGISTKGSIAMHDIYRASPTDWQSWWYGAQVRRSVFADDYIYAISDLGIRVVHNQDLTTPIATSSFYP